MNIQRLLNLITQNILTNNITNVLKTFIPRLDNNLHKGQLGRLGVIGGSVDFTGAPYYTAQSTLYFGGDLVNVFTAKEALIPIKSYSPELMVTSLYNTEEIESLENTSIQTLLFNKLQPHLSKLHSIVIGPGLGRHPKLLPNLLFTIQQISQLKIL